MTRNFPIFISTLIISLTLAGCSLNATTMTESNTQALESNASQAKQLAENYQQTLLAHREAGAIPAHAFEAKDRQAIRNQLDLDFATLNQQAMEHPDQLQNQLLILDQQLENYRHATHQGSEFRQLWSLIPVLPTLEKRKALTLVLATQQAVPENLKNQRMATLMDLQLNYLFNTFVINVDGLTPETQAFEAELVQQLKAQGFNISARRPSLILQYFIEAYDTEQGLEVIGDFELKDRDSKPFQTLSSVITVEHNTDVPRQIAIKQLTQEVSDLMLQQALQRVQNVNQSH